MMISTKMGVKSLISRTLTKVVMVDLGNNFRKIDLRTLIIIIPQSEP